MVSWVLAGRRWADAAFTKLLAHKSTLTAKEMVTQLSPIPDWENSPVRAMDLHPRLPYIALARQDDAIEIRDLSGMEPGIVLRDRDQSLVTCLQWAPHANSLLAVGSKVGVLLWFVDPSQPACRFLTSWVRVETSPGHVPVATISWSPCANYLVSGSPADTNLVVWDVPMGVATRVCRTEGGGVNLVAMAPRGGRVLAGSVGGVLRVWETGNWTCEKWTNTSEARCQVACWSPDGDFLLFALHGDPALYYLCFRGNSTAGSVSAVKCADLSPCAYRDDSGHEPIVVGGAVQSMAWDSTGERLAIIFTEESPGHNLVAVLRTKISTVVEVLPGGYVRGEGGDIPQMVTFQRNCCHGALLATAWLSGRVSFTPLLFTHLPSSLLPSFPIPPSLHQSQLYSTYNEPEYY
ncbi:Aladin [Geodia barretti]|uniref:Aladin n=3 Tax=Geodia barretti TaxID=519541 RepID=A0AA35X118_GEOBA|nr:Aladin [Geodia barretti]